MSDEGPDDIHGGNFRFHSGVTGVVEGFFSLVGPNNGVTPCGTITPLLTGVKEFPGETVDGVPKMESDVIFTGVATGVALAVGVAKPGCNNF